MATEATGLTAKCRTSVGSSYIRDCGRDASEMVVRSDLGEPICKMHAAAYRRRRYQSGTIKPIDEACIAHWDAVDEERRQRKAEAARREAIAHQANVAKWTAATQAESKVIYEARHQPRSRYGGDPDVPRWVVVPVDTEMGREPGLGDGAEVSIISQYGETRLDIRNGNRLTISEAEALIEALRLAVAKAKESR